MQLSDLPARFPIPFASGASSPYIRAIPTDHVAAGAGDAPASLFDGFPPETFTPIGSGGTPPSGADFNGILNQLTAWARWGAAGGPAVFNSTFCTTIGGYPKGATLMSVTTPGLTWISLVENNLTDPDSVGAANWRALGGSTSASLATNGFEIRPSGLIDQWGQVFVARDGTVAVTFPMPFPTAVYNLQLSWVDSTIGSGSPQGSAGTSAPSLTGFTIYNDGDNRVHHWRALGQ